MDLKQYFQENNAQNVTVLDLPSSPYKTMSELHKKMLSMPAGSWMIDELCMPYPNDHTKWAGELQKMRSHMAVQPGQYMLWISIAGIFRGKPEHFKHNYLAPLMPGFHVPVMEFPLRNTKEVIKLAGLGSNKANKKALVTLIITTNPSILSSTAPHVRRPVPAVQSEEERRCRTFKSCGTRMSSDDAEDGGLRLPCSS